MTEASEIILSGWFVLARFEMRNELLFAEFAPDFFDSGHASPKFQLRVSGASIKPSFDNGVQLIGHYVMQVEKLGASFTITEEFGKEILIIGGSGEYGFVDQDRDDLLRIIAGYERRSKEDHSEIRGLQQKISAARSWATKGIDRTERILQQRPPEREKYLERLNALRSILELLK